MNVAYSQNKNCVSDTYIYGKVIDGQKNTITFEVSQHWYAKTDIDFKIEVNLHHVSKFSTFHKEMFQELKSIINDKQNNTTFCFRIPVVNKKTYFLKNVESIDRFSQPGPSK